MHAVFVRTFVRQQIVLSQKYAFFHYGRADGTFETRLSALEMVARDVPREARDFCKSSRVEPDSPAMPAGVCSGIAKSYRYKAIITFRADSS